MISDKELRAALLIEYGYDVSGESELLPLLKLMYDNRQAAGKCLETLEKNNWPKKTRFYWFDDDRKAFLHGLGQWGIAAILAVVAGAILVYGYINTMNSHNETAKGQELLSSFITYSREHGPKLLKVLEDKYNRDTANTLKIEFFPSDTVVVVGK